MLSLNMDSEINAWIDDQEDAIIDFLRQYITYRSPTEQEQEVQREFVESFFADQMDWDSIDIVDVSEEQNRPNINGRLSGTGDGAGRTLLFNGHSDIVDVSEEAAENWAKDPWDPIVEDGYLYGRGANDMKGPNTAMIWAAKAVMEADTELSGDLLMSIVVGEELNQQEYGSIAATDAFLEEGIEIPICINTEPTNLEIHTKSAATFDFTIEIQGKEAHTSQKNLTRYPQRYGIPVGQDVGVDAAMIMADILYELRDLEHQWNLRYRDQIYGGGGYQTPDTQGVGPIGINCTIMEAGDYIAAIPGHARIEGHVFYPPFVDDRELWDEMQDVVETLAATNDWLKEHPPQMSWKNVFDWPPYEVPVDHPGCKALGTAIETTLGEQPVYSGFKAVTDNSYIQNECGVDTISMGPGDISMGAHGPDEHIPTEQLMNATKVYAAMILEWCR